MALSATELASMRADSLTLMPDTCTVLRKVLTPDGQGGYTEAWGDLADHACYVASAPMVNSATEGVVSGAQTLVASHIVTLPFDADVTNEDRIATGDHVLEVQSTGSRSWPVNLRAACKEVG